MPEAGGDVRVPPLPLAEDVQGLTPPDAPRALVRAQAELVRWARALAEVVVTRRRPTAATQADAWARIGATTRVDASDGPVRVWVPPAGPGTAGLALAVVVEGAHQVTLTAAPGGSLDGQAELEAAPWQELESDGSSGWHTVRGFASLPIEQQSVASASTTTWRQLRRWPIAELVPADERVRTLGVVLRVSDPSVTGARDVVRMHGGVHRDDAGAHVVQDYDGEAVSTGSVEWGLPCLEAGTTLTTRLAVSSSVVTLDARASSTADVEVEGSLWLEALR